MSVYTKKILPDSFYHIYNSGNNYENIFYSEKNYFYFLRKYNEYLTPYLQTYVFCLLPNHFHFLVKTCGYSGVVSEQFRKFFSIYAQKINEQTGRSGSLFLKPFRRKIITNENHLQKLIFYIHYNPVYHNISKTFENYIWSSYKRILNPKKTNLQKQKVMELFNGREGYTEFHRSIHDLKSVREIIIE